MCFFYYIFKQILKMVEKEKATNNSFTKDDENIIKNIKENEDNNNFKIKKSKTVKNKQKKGNKANVKVDNTNSKKVKFNNNIEFINIECWKKYNLEQTADENLEALFIDYEDKENKDDKKINKKGRNNISCTCNII